MISVDQALKKLLKDAQPVCDVEVISIQDALSRVLAKPVTSSVHVPPADNSSMDGYAVRAVDIEPGKTYSISQRITAGRPPTQHIGDTASRIFTGAEIPEGADAVIIQENAQAIDAQPRGTQTGNGSVRFDAQVSKGDNIRNKGQDVFKGSEILPAGIRLRPQEIGLITSCGISKVSAYKPLKLALVSTGDELINLGTDIKPGQIYNSNKYLIAALCQQAGIELIDMGIVEDNFEATKTRLELAAKEADIVMTTGGVSVGEEDHVKAAVETVGNLELWKVAIKPGKPLAFGKIGNTDFIGLPGNPSSVFTTFLIMALPRLRAMQGIRAPKMSNIEYAPLSEKLPALFEKDKVSRREYLRAQRTGNSIDIFPNQSSGVLSSACWGDGFAIQYEQTSIERDQLVEFIPYLNLY